MNLNTHSLYSLFEQSGLDNSEKAIDVFVAKHGSMPANIKLQQANFWRVSQRVFFYK